MKPWLYSIQDLFFPEHCIHCNTKTTIQNNLSLCLSCEIKLESASTQEDKNNALFDRFKGIIKIEYAIAQFYFSKNGVSQSIIHEAKYNGNLHILKHYANVISQEIKRKNWLQNTPDIIVPVPNNWFKKLRVGYNQASVYSQILANNLNIKHVPNALIKNHEFNSQTKRNKLERLKLLTNLYRMNPKIDVKNKHVLLVDDVITSGATIETCAELLFQNGATEVSICTFMLVKQTF